MSAMREPGERGSAAAVEELKQQVSARTAELEQREMGGQLKRSM